MPDPNARQPENVPGAFYVDTTCIDCDVCRDIAPDNFMQQEDKGCSFVYRQPGNEQQLSLCREALAACPVEAIGSDG